jgi:hypothetical protein
MRKNYEVKGNKIVIYGEINKNEKATVEILVEQGFKLVYKTKRPAKRMSEKNYLAFIPKERHEEFKAIKREEKSFLAAAKWARETFPKEYKVAAAQKALAESNTKKNREKLEAAEADLKNAKKETAKIEEAPAPQDEKKVVNF